MDIIQQCRRKTSYAGAIVTETRQWKWHVDCEMQTVRRTPPRQKNEEVMTVIIPVMVITDVPESHWSC